MDVPQRIAAGLPSSVEDVDADPPRKTSELWLFARAYSRLRHRTGAAPERRRLESLKYHCIRAALAREPTLFIVVVDPGFPHLRLVYHRDERNLLHVPLTIDLGVFPLQKEREINSHLSDRGTIARDRVRSK